MAALTAQDIPSLCQVLQGALSNDVNTQKSSEDTLKSLEERVGYASCLVEMLANKAVDHSLRWLAATQLKNCVVRHWRPNATAPGSITEQERAHIRLQLLRLIEQDDNQIASQVAITYAKIARVDYPRTWPTLFAELLALPQQPNCPTVVVRRVYLILHAVLKELATRRLAADQHTFGQVSEQLLEPMWQQWMQDTSALSAGLPAVLQGLASVRLSPSDPLLMTFERWLFVLKVLRRIVLFGYPSDVATAQEIQAVVKVAPGLHSCFVGMLSFGATVEQLRAPRGPGGPVGGPVGTRLLALLDRSLLKLAKTHVNLQERFPWTLFRCGTLGTHMDLCCNNVVTSGWRDTSQASQRITVQLMLFLHQVGSCKAYRTANMGTAAQEVTQYFAQFWSVERVQAVLQALLQHYLPLTVKELREWHDAPEDFHLGTEVEHQDHLRPAAVQLFQQLVEAHQSIAMALLQQALATVQQMCPPGAPFGTLQGGPASAPGSASLQAAPQAVLLKAALYDAVGLAHDTLQDAIDFAALLQAAVLPDIACAAVHLWPVKRQAMKLLGQWASKLQPEQYPTVYNVLSDVLAPTDQDAALSLMAVHALHCIVDDWGFREEHLLPHLPVLFERLARLLTSLDELDSMSQVFSLVNLLIQRLGSEIQPLVPGLLQLLPAVWTAAEGQTLLKLQVLAAMSRLVNAMGLQSPAAYSVVLPLLHASLGSSDNEALVLTEDGLALWLVALRNAPSVEAAQQLLQLLPYLGRIMAQSTEYLPLCCAIMRSSLYLGREQLVAAYGGLLNELMVQLLGNVNDIGMCLLLGVLELCVQVCPDAKHLAALQPALVRVLACALSQQTSETITVSSVAVLGRVLLLSPQDFLGLFDSAAASGLAASVQPCNRNALVCQYADTWLDGLDNITSALQRKLSALAACQLLTLPVPNVVQRLDLIVMAVTAAVAEGHELQVARPLAVTEYLEGDLDEAVAASADAQGETTRREECSSADNIVTLQPNVVFQQCWRGARELHGTALQQAVQNIDPQILSGLSIA